MKKRSTLSILAALCGIALAVIALPARTTELVYSSFLGGAAQDQAGGVAVDADGYTWIAGYTNSPDFPVTGSTLPALGRHEVFVTKIDPQGQVVWSTLLGGSGDDLGFAIAVDASGHAYVSGVTGSRDFPQVHAVQGPSSQLVDAFVAKLSPAGDALLYSTYLGGNGEDQGEALAIDPQGHAYVVGRTSSSNFPAVNAFQPDFGGGGLDLFVAKLAPGGSSLVYSTYLGGNNVEIRMGVAADARGNAYVVGATGSPDFPVVGALQPVLNGSSDGFVTKIAPDGSGPVFSTFFGGSGADAFEGIALDPDGGLYLAGFTTSSDYPVVNAVQPELGGADFDAVVTRLAPGARDVLWSTYLGGSQWDWALAIAVDARRSVHVTGHTQSTDFPLEDPVRPVCGTLEAPGRCATQVFVTRLASDGSHLEHSTYLGDGAGRAIAADPRSASTVVGTAGPVFSLAQAFQPEYGGGFSDAFVSRIAPSGQPPDCSAAVASPSLLWPPNGKLRPVAIHGVTAPNGGPVAISVTAVHQDEPLAKKGQPDATGIGTSRPMLRASRAGTGDGRVYHITFEATDPAGAACTGTVTVCVPHDQGKRTCGDGGPLFASNR